MSAFSFVIKDENVLSKLAEELCKPIIRKFEKQKYAYLLETMFGILILPCHYFNKV